MTKVPEVHQKIIKTIFNKEGASERLTPDLIDEVSRATRLRAITVHQYLSAMGMLNRPIDAAKKEKARKAAQETETKPKRMSHTDLEARRQSDQAKLQQQRQASGAFSSVKTISTPLDEADKVMAAAYGVALERSNDGRTPKRRTETTPQPVSEDRRDMIRRIAQRLQR